MRSTFAIIWVALIAAGAWYISWRSKAVPVPPAAPSPPAGCLTQAQKQGLPHGIALQPMQVNWLVRAADLKPPAPNGVVGLYVACKLAGGDFVVASDVGGKPKIPVVAGKVLLPIPLSAIESDSLNAGSHVTLLAEKTDVVTAAEVAALDCKTSCVALLEVTPAERQSYNPAELPKLHLVVH